jgi:hypothetical protein
MVPLGKCKMCPQQKMLVRGHLMPGWKNLWGLGKEPLNSRMV